MKNKIITISELQNLILDKTNRGRNYYEAVIPDLEEISEDELESTRNPLIDKAGTIKIQYQSDQWIYSFGTGKGVQIGDVFGFCARINGLDRIRDYFKVCGIIDGELCLGLSPIMEIKVKSDESDESDGIPPGAGKRILLPRIPLAIYPSLPAFLKALLDHFDSKQDKDILLLSTLTVLSGCFPKVYGKYARKKVHLNIYSMIAGPASVGKSVAKWSRVILEFVEDEYEKKQKMLFFPADVSFAALIENLACNDGKGIIFAFEADTLTQNFTKDWGNTTALLRQAYEHERYDNMRKGEKGKPTIINALKKPALSILLTGTPNQIASLISDTEDGLFSRFNFYQVELDPTWKSVFPNPEDENVDTSLDELLKPLKTIAYNIFQAYNKLPSATIRFDLTREQKSQLDSHFAAMSEKHKTHTNTNAIATIRRQGVVCFRLAGILTAIRIYEKPGELLICTDEDFNTAIALSNVFSQHAFSIARQLPGSFKKQLSGQKKDFFFKLPVNFNWQEAIKVGETLDMKEDLVEKYLKDFQPEYIEHPKHNMYRKVM